MVYSMLSPQHFNPIPSSVSSKHLNSSFHSYLPYNSHLHFNNNKREIYVPSVASSSVPYQQPINVDYLQREFSGQGVTFENIGDTCIAKLELDNGSTATLMLPSGTITSYKVPVWHGGKVELLHTSVFEGADGGAVIKGGVSLAFESQTDGGISLPASNWVLQDISRNSEDSVHVELIRSDTDNMVEMKYSLLLQEETLSSEITISNSNSLPLEIKGSIISHLTVSTPDATYAIGLQGSNFIETKPFLSKFGIIPDEDEENEGNNSGFGEMLHQLVPKGTFRGFEGNNGKEKEEEMEGEETSNYKQLNKEMSRIYSSAPQNFTIIDRGRRNSVVVGREGFEELYMLSPGSRHESFSKFAYICVGQSALLKPITLKPGDVWRGAQHLHNPNL